MLLSGEVGVGKAQVARLLHAQSKTAGDPFLLLSRASSLEAEVFGQEKGTLPARSGLLEFASRGTLFLVEIAGTHAEFQTKLCGLLESQSFRRAGGTHDLMSAVRSIVGTSVDLEEEVRQGRFDGNLLERLEATSTRIPALRERREDILDLAGAFLRQFNAEFGKSIGRFEESAKSALLEHPWPGNVRELRLCIERAVLLGTGNVLRRCDLMLRG